MPQWRQTIDVSDVFHNGDLTFPNRRDAIVARLKDSGWPATNADVTDLVDELGQAETTGEFDEIWNALYDEADLDRVWIETLRFR